MISISIVMAVYNGELFISQQIDSIIPQMEKYDELVISYDESTDGTFHIITDYANKDTRVHIFKNQIKGVSENFTNAVIHASKDVVVFSDQDDVWCEGKLAAIRKAYENPGIDMVEHDCMFVDSELNPLSPDSFFQAGNRSFGFLSNYYKSKILGCCISVRRGLLNCILPFPSPIYWDVYMVLCLAALRKNCDFCDQILILHRRHDGTVSGIRRPPLKIIRDRILLLYYVCKTILKLKLPKK